jgi:hypothetical protein
MSSLKFVFVFDDQVNDMGPNLDSKSVAKIESLAKTMDRELSSTEAKIVASMLQVHL